MTVAADGTLYFVTAGKKCGLTGGESQGLWRVPPADPEARPEEVLPGALFGASGDPDASAPLALRLIEAGPLAGRMVLTGLRGAHGVGSVSIAAPPDFSFPSPYPDNLAVVPQRLCLLPDGSLLWSSPGDPAVHRYDASRGTVRDLASPYGADAVAFTLDERGDLYLLTRTPSRSRLVILDPDGNLVYEQGLAFVPVAVGVLGHP